DLYSRVRLGTTWCDVGGHTALIDRRGDGVLHRLRLDFQSERVSKHESDAENGADGIRDAAASDVGSGTMDRLVESATHAPTLPTSGYLVITKRRRPKHGDRSGHQRRPIRADAPEQSLRAG